MQVKDETTRGAECASPTVPPHTPPRPDEPPGPEPTGPPEGPGLPPGESRPPRPGGPVSREQGRPARPGSERVVKRSGRFALAQTEQGFFWTFADLAGARWYWHPQERRWTGGPCASPTAEEATAGLDPDAPQAEGHFRHHEARPAGSP
jgi:hypothetical protein